jgi:hypothetical protein
MIAPIGTHIGVRHTTGEWIPAEVTGGHSSGATLVQTVSDPTHDQPGVSLAIPPGAQQNDYWKHANACEFRRKCGDCRGFGCDHCENGWVIYDPWKDAAREDGVAADAQTAAHGDLPL